MKKKKKMKNSLTTKTWGEDTTFELQTFDFMFYKKKIPECTTTSTYGKP